MSTEPYNIFWNSKKYIYETEETSPQNSFNGLNYNRENNFWIYSNDYETCIPNYDYSTEDVLPNNDTTIYITDNNSNEPALETIMNDIESGGLDDDEQVYNNVSDNNNDGFWASYFMPVISAVNNFILGITENSPEKNKDA